MSTRDIEESDRSYRSVPHDVEIVHLGEEDSEASQASMHSLCLMLSLLRSSHSTSNEGLVRLATEVDELSSVV